MDRFVFEANNIAIKDDAMIEEWKQSLDTMKSELNVMRADPASITHQSGNFMELYQKRTALLRSGASRFGRVYRAAHRRLLLEQQVTAKASMKQEGAAKASMIQEAKAKTSGPTNR
jgi:hypothetical protein